MAEGARRPARVEVDLSAIEHNATVLAAIAAPARLCAVVKANAYGHGEVAVAKAAIAGGATELAVAIVDEGVELRDAGVEVPILVLAEPSAQAMEEVFAYGLTPTVYTEEGVARAAAAARHHAANRDAGPATVEVKVDTGMHRVGVDPAALTRLVAHLEATPSLRLGGLWTHLAVADEPGNEMTTVQIARFRAACEALQSAGLGRPPRLHAANTAGTITGTEARFDMVRCGIGLYGYAPSPAMVPALAAAVAAAGQGEGLRSALSLVAEVSAVRHLPAGERASYGLLRPLPADALVATVPLGYADGIPRAYFTGGGEVLVHGRRRPLAGGVTMDQIVVDCGDDLTVRPGDEVVLIGRQGDERLGADDWAERLGTIAYEVTTRIGPRVPRSYRGGSAAGNCGDPATAAPRNPRLDR